MSQDVRCLSKSLTCSISRTVARSRHRNFWSGCVVNGKNVTLCGLLLLLALPAVAETLSGRVVAVADGDTLTMLIGESQQVKIRLAGIDSPEKKQDFGQKAKAALSDLAFNKTATAECRKKDRYQRSVCVVTVADRDVGLEQIKAGMAWWYRKYISEQSAGERASYEAAETEAKTRRRGLWSLPNPVPPWDWRKGERLAE